MAILWFESFPKYFSCLAQCWFFGQNFWLADRKNRSCMVCRCLDYCSLLELKFYFFLSGSRAGSRFYILFLIYFYLNGMTFLKVYVHSTSDWNCDTSFDDFSLSFDQSQSVDRSQITSTSETNYPLLKPNENPKNWLFLINNWHFLKVFVHSTSDCDGDTSCENFSLSFDQSQSVDHSQITSTSETNYTLLKPN